jgi:CubicO group peptidase (beta-lactamase class C family)
VDKKTKKPTLSDTIYLVASVSKTFVMEQTVRAYLDGKISSLDDDVCRYVPDFVINNPFAVGAQMSNVARAKSAEKEARRRACGSGAPTFRAMLSHLSGLSREAPCNDVFCLNTDTATILARLRHMSLVRAPETYPSYSNLAFALLGNLISERLYNETFEHTLARITRGLAMKWTGVNITNEVMERMAVAYQIDGM